MTGNKINVLLAEGDPQPREVIEADILLNGLKLYNYPLGVLEAKELYPIIGLDLIVATRLPVEIHADEFQAIFAKYKTAPIEEILESASVDIKDSIEYHDDSQSFEKELESAIRRNLETSESASAIEPFALEFIDDRERTRVHWQHQPNLGVEFNKHMDKVIAEWQEKGIIRELYDSNSRFNTKLFGVKQPGKLRVVGSFGHINALLAGDTNDLPNIDEEIIRLAEKAGVEIWITKIDLTSAYYQIRVAECDQPILAFQHNGKKYCFQRVTFGLQQMPLWFHRQIREILQRAGCNDAASFIDDIWVISFSRKSHVEQMSKVLNTLTDFNLTINRDKCVWGARKLKLLGLVVSGQGVTIDHNRILNMLEWERPKTRKQLQKLLGWLNYNRRFIRNYADKTEIFYNLLNVKSADFKWTEMHENLYCQLYEELSNGTMLHHRDPTCPLEMRCDASDVALGCEISQHRTADKLELVALNSRKLRGFELNYTVPKKELLSAVFFLKNMITC